MNFFPRAENYSDFESIKTSFSNLKEINQNDLNIKGLSKDNRCFILRSNNDDDIHKAMKYSIWTSTPKNNEILDKVYQDSQKNKYEIYLFFRYLFL